MATKRRAEPLALGSRFLLPPPPPPQKRSRRELEPSPWDAAAAPLCSSSETLKKKRKREEGMEPPGGRKRKCSSNNSDQDDDDDDEDVTFNCKCPSAAGQYPKEKERVFLRGGSFLKPEDEEEKKSASSTGSQTQENEDDVWSYNSFQYWRSPLPTIHLSDILDLENNKAVDERGSSSTGMSEMET